MNDRHAYALAHPLNTAYGAAPAELRRIRPHPRGYLLVSILAVDR